MQWVSQRLKVRLEVLPLSRFSWTHPEGTELHVGRVSITNTPSNDNTMNKSIYYIGLDVHKESVAISYISSNSRSEAIYQGTCGGSNLAVERALRKLAKQLKVKFNIRSHRIPEWEHTLTKWLTVKIRVNHNYGAAQGFGADYGRSRRFVPHLRYTLYC